MTVQELAKAHNWNMVTKCPYCDTDLKINANHTRLYCPNEFCPSMSTGTIMKWCDVHGIKELGLTTLEKIQEQGYFLTVSRLYLDPCLPECNVKMFSLLGKNWVNITEEIEAHRKTTLAKFLAGYNISGLGEKSVQKVLSAHSIETFNQLYDSTIPDRFTCDGIGFITSKKFKERCALKYHMLDEVTVTEVDGKKKYTHVYKPISEVANAPEPEPPTP